MLKLPSANSRNIMLVIIFVACLASGGIFVRMSELGPINTGLWRIIFSIPILLPFIFAEQNKIEHRKLEKKDIVVLLVAGGFLAGDLSVWNISFHYTTIANANLLANFVPLIIIPISYFVFKEPIAKKFFIGFVIVLVGVILLVYGKQAITSLNLYGDSLAFLTSIFYAIFLLLVYRLRHKATAVQIMFVSAFGSTTILFIIALLTEGIQVPSSWPALLPILGLTVFSQLLGQGGLSYTLGRISASYASVLVLTQPVISALYAFLLFREKLSSLEVVAMLIVLCGIYILKKGD